MTGKDLANARFRLGFSGSDLARLFHVHPSTVSRWENVPDCKVDPLHERLIDAFVKLSRHASPNDLELFAGILMGRIWRFPDGLEPLTTFLEICERTDIIHGQS